MLVPTLLREPRITAGEVCGAIVGPGCGAWEEINSWTIHIPDKERETAGGKEGPRGEPLRYGKIKGDDLTCSSEGCCTSPTSTST